MAVSLIEGLAEQARIGDDDTFRMPNGSEIAVSRVKQRYADFAGQYGFREVARRIAREHWLGDAADDICKKQGQNVSVFGHTHDATIDKDSLFVEDRIYANAGTWCDDNKKAHCVEIDKPARGGRVVVRLRTVGENGAIENTRREEVG
jgi:hypothetical protein